MLYTQAQRTYQPTASTWRQSISTVLSKDQKANLIKLQIFIRSRPNVISTNKTLRAEVIGYTYSLLRRANTRADTLERVCQDLFGQSFLLTSEVHGADKGIAVRTTQAIYLNRIEKLLSSSIAI